jgi:hypothetical protein
VVFGLIFGRKSSQKAQNQILKEVSEMTDDDWTIETKRQNREDADLASYEAGLSDEKKAKLDSLADKHWKDFEKMKKHLNRSDNAPKN